MSVISGTLHLMGILFGVLKEENIGSLLLAVVRSGRSLMKSIFDLLMCV